MQAIDSSFWDFFVHVYGGSGVADLLIDLQDRCDADVNLILYCWWCGLSGLDELTHADFDRLDKAIAPWRDAAIAPLRQIRRALKLEPAFADLAGAEAARQQILSAEIAAEGVAQRCLEAMSGGRGNEASVDAVLRNWRAYLLWLGVEGLESHLARLSRILD